jgi:hypothetical protein
MLLTASLATLPLDATVHEAAAQPAGNAPTGKKVLDEPRVRFERGLELYRDGAFDAALLGSSAWMDHPSSSLQHRSGELSAQTTPERCTRLKSNTWCKRGESISSAKAKFSRIDRLRGASRG